MEATLIHSIQFEDVKIDVYSSRYGNVLMLADVLRALGAKPQRDMLIRLLTPGQYMMLSVDGCNHMMIDLRGLDVICKRLSHPQAMLLLSVVKDVFDSLTNAPQRPPTAANIQIGTLTALQEGMDRILDLLAKMAASITAIDNRISHVEDAMSVMRAQQGPPPAFRDSSAAADTARIEGPTTTAMPISAWVAANPPAQRETVGGYYLRCHEYYNAPGQPRRTNVSLDEVSEAAFELGYGIVSDGPGAPSVWCPRNK